MFECDEIECTFRGKTRRSISDHKSKVHRSLVECRDCHRRMKPASLRQHRLNKHGSKPQQASIQVSCLKCGRELLKKNLKRHLRFAHSRPKKHLVTPNRLETEMAKGSTPDPPTPEPSAIGQTTPRRHEQSPQLNSSFLQLLEQSCNQEANFSFQLDNIESDLLDLADQIDASGQQTVAMPSLPAQNHQHGSQQFPWYGTREFAQLFADGKLPHFKYAIALGSNELYHVRPGFVYRSLSKYKIKPKTNFRRVLEEFDEEDRLAAEAKNN